MFVLIGVNELKGLSCGTVLWTGNITLNLLMLLGVMRDWEITVMSDRIMRKKYRWTLQTIPLITIAILSVVCTAFSTLGVQFFSQEYLYLNHKHQCFFLTPWWELLPLAVPVFLTRNFLALRKKHLQNNGPDYFGVFFEMKAFQIVAVPLLPLYLIYTHLFIRSNNPSPVSPSYILILFPIAASLVVISAPCFKAIFRRKSKKKSKKCIPKAINQVMVSPQPRSSKSNSTTSSPISKILDKKCDAEAFRRHAQRSFCTESVDFCMEVLLFKNSFLSKMESLNMDVKVSMHQHFVRITDEFIVGGATSEVNISFRQKQNILEARSFEVFSALDKTKILSIFDEAEKEIEKVLEPVLFSFLLVLKH